MKEQSQACNGHISFPWTLAKRVSVAGNVWQLEAFKAVLEQERSLYNTELSPRWSVGTRLAFVVGAIVGFALFIFWVVRVRASGQLPVQGKRFVALHGELSTRTRHVLDAMKTADPQVEAIVLLGRLRRPVAQIERIWTKAGFNPLPPLIVPVNLRAAFRMIVDIPVLWRAGWQAAGVGLGPLPLRVWVSIGFRVWHGATMARWWGTQQLASDFEVILGISGTADTTLLERAIHAHGGRSIHAVHGQSVGPNFMGFSDLALFRSGYDAANMRVCSSYGRCDVQPASPVMPQRGTKGLLLLTNLAHPMNADFRRDGLVDELAVLTAVAEAAQLLGLSEQPLLWKPHPVISTLPSAQTKTLREEAARLGWFELPLDTPAAIAAANVVSVVSTPSTVALDLLHAGALCVIVDPRERPLTTAPAMLPRATCTSPEIAAILRTLSDHDEYSAHFATAWDAIKPARPLDLARTFD